VQPLLNHHLVPAGEIVQPGGHGAVEPLHRRAPFGIRFGLIHTVRIVHNHHVGPFSGSRSAYGGRDAIARAIILEAVLLVLIAGQLVALAPALLIPRRFNQPPAFEAVVHAQLGGVAGKQPADLRVVDPLTPAQLQAVIAHELCHVRCRDNLKAAIHMFVETVFCFHPLVWWMGKRMVEERERACDEEVLRLGSEPQAYAEGILNICRLYVESLLACVSGVTGSSLKPRIQMILANRKVHRVGFAKKAALAIAGITALLLPLGIGMMNAPRVQAQSATAAAPKFEVASIKPCKPGTPPGGKDASPGRLSYGCAPLGGCRKVSG